MWRGTRVWSRWGCACVKVDFRGEEQPDNNRESCAAGLMGREGEEALAGEWGWWLEAGNCMEKRFAMEEEKPESSMRGGGMNTTAELETSAVETSEQRVMPRSWKHIEVGTAIEIRRMRDTVIRTKWFDLSWVIYSPNFPLEILNRLKWFQMLSLFRTIQQNVCCFEKKKKKGGVKDWEKKERKNKKPGWSGLPHLNFIAELGWVKKNHSFCFLSGNFTYKAALMWMLTKLRCSLHVYSNMKWQKARICASETLSRKFFCTRISQHGDNFITKFRHVFMETFLLAALEIILYLELLGT